MNEPRWMLAPQCARLVLVTMLGPIACTDGPPVASPEGSSSGTVDGTASLAGTVAGDTTAGDTTTGGTTSSTTSDDTSGSDGTTGSDSTTGTTGTTTTTSTSTSSTETSTTSTETTTTETSTTDSGETTTGTTGVVDPLMAHDDGPYATDAGAILLVDAAQGVLANDEGVALVVVAHDLVSAEGGAVLVGPDGSFSYAPPLGLPYGTDRFSYTVEDGMGGSAVAEVRVAVQPVGGAVSLGGLGSKGVRVDGSGASTFSGYAVSGAGDVDGDGEADLLIGAYGPPPMVSGGESYLVHGGAGLPAVINAFMADVRLRGVADGDFTGWAVSGAGDVNGDGHADLLIGAPGADPGGVIGAGETYLVYGGPAMPAILNLAAASVRIMGVGGESGRAVSGAGDVNGDGYADLLIGAYAAWPNGVFQAGEGYLVLGGPALPAVVGLADAAVRFQGIDESDRAGISVSGAGDVNGDGHADMLVGAYWADPVAAFGGPFATGQAYLVLGGPVLPAVMSLVDADVRFDGVAPAADVGWAVTAAGDVDGDGYDDVLIGDRYAGAAVVGAAHLFYGAPVLPAVVGTDVADVRFDGIAADDAAGQDVSGAGDVNGDGYADLLVSAYFADPGGVANAGESYLVLGGPALPAVMSLADADLRLQGVDAQDWSGHAVSGAGDVDGDGYADVLVGVPQADSMFGGQNPGETFVVYGDDLTATTTVLGTPGPDVLWAIHGLAADVVVAGREDDVLHCDGGPDVLRGGAGDDTLVVVDAAFFRLDGGLGYDTLELGGGVALDEMTLACPRVVGIERLLLDLGGPSSVEVSELLVVGLSDTSNELTIDGDADDQVTLLPGTWLGPALDGGYLVYTSASTAAVLRVDPAITVLEP